LHIYTCYIMVLKWYYEMFIRTWKLS
jgi:hypothetical protein